MSVDVVIVVVPVVVVVSGFRVQGLGQLWLELVVFVFMVVEITNSRTVVAVVLNIVMATT